MEKHSRICAYINLDDFVHNLNEIRRMLAPGTKVCAVIKTDGYGHGAAVLADVLEKREEIWGYAVATTEEAVSLRSRGFIKPILILGYVFEEDLHTLVDLDIRPTVFSLESAKEISDIALLKNHIVKIHVKLDTGMGRIGFPCTEKACEETIKAIAQIASLPNIMIEGIFTHFARADEVDKTYARTQAQRFFSIADGLKKQGINIPIRHISNSAGIIDLPQYNLDMVRAGIILYGLWPSDEVQKDRIDLKPILSLKSHVVYVKKMTEGETIGYGGTYQVHGEQRIATIPVGYGDGYPRALSNKGYVLIHGQRAPICGRGCMDQFMVNISDIPVVRPGDEVVLVGHQGEETITVDDIGALSGRFNYEFACDLGKRIPRLYLKDGVLFEPDAALR